MPAPRFVRETLRHEQRGVRVVSEEWDAAGVPVDRLALRHPGAVGIIAQPSPDRLLLVRQFRYPVRRWTLEIPAGTRVPGEPPETTAARELAEETGWRCQRLTLLLDCLVAIGLSDERLLLYRADGLTPGSAAPEPGEIVGPEILPLTALSAAAADGAICDAKTFFALALLGLPLPRPAPHG